MPAQTRSKPHARADVLALVTDAFGGYGGIAQYNRDFLSALCQARPRFNLAVLPRIAPNALEAMPVNLRQYAPVHPRARYALQSLYMAFQKKPSIVFCGHLFHSVLALSIARMVGAKLIVQLHGTEIWTTLASAHRRALEAADLVLVVSRDTRARLLAKADVAPERVLVVNNTVGAEFSPGDRDKARHQFGLAEDWRAVLSVARLDCREGYKGHDRVITELATLGDKVGKLIYLIAGTGDDRPRLEALASRLGLSSQVRFLGHVPRTQLPALYRAADLFALPSTGEGFGIAFLEAMSCGTPAIGLAVGGSPDALGDGDLGRCVNAEEFPAAFLSALQQQRPSGLHEQVDARFGATVFRTRINLVLDLLDEMPPRSSDKRLRLSRQTAKLIKSIKR